MEINIDKRRFITGIGSHGYGGREVLQSGVCKSEKHKSGSTNHQKLEGMRSRGFDGLSSRARRPENQKLQCPRTGKYQHPSSRRERILPDLTFCSLQALTGLDDPAHFGAD